MVGIKLQQSDFKQVGALVRIITKTISQISLNFFILGIAVKLMNSLIDFNFLSRIFNVFRRNICLNI